MLSTLPTYPLALPPATDPAVLSTVSSKPADTVGSRRSRWPRRQPLTSPLLPAATIMSPGYTAGFQHCPLLLPPATDKPLGRCIPTISRSACLQAHPRPATSIPAVRRLLPRSPLASCQLPATIIPPGQLPASRIATSSLFYYCYFVYGNSRYWLRGIKKKKKKKKKTKRKRVSNMFLLKKSTVLFSSCLRAPSHATTAWVLL